MSNEVMLSWTAKMNQTNGDVVSVELLFDDGECVQKNVTFSDFRQIINEATDLYDQIRIGKLPHGFYDGSLDVKDPKTFTVVIVVPSGMRTVGYFDTEYDIPYPATVFRFEVRNGRLNESNAFFVKKDAPDGADVLCQYCFGNVSSNLGGICWGGNQLPALTSMKDVDRLVALFFGSPCNDDYYSYSRFSSGAPEYCKTQRALYEHLKGCEVFPLEILAETALCVKDLLGAEEPA